MHISLTQSCEAGKIVKCDITMHMTSCESKKFFYGLFPQSVKESLLNQSCEAEKGD